MKEKSANISDLKFDERNANRHSPFGMAQLEKGLRQNGLGRSILLSSDNEIIAGNGVTETAGSIGIEKVRIIETDGKEIIAVKRLDIKSGSKEFYQMALSDNIIAQNNIAMDAEVTEAICEEYDIKEWQVDQKEPKEKEEKPIWVPDCLFPSNNPYDIPTLLKHKSNLYVDLPLRPWGADARTKTGIGTYHFYVDDYRFENIWNDPSKVIQSGCKNIVEPNLSLYETTPISYGIFLIYKKRWIARFLQEYKINVFVDLNVTEKFMPYNIMGVPEGYNAFFTRGYDNRLKALENQFAAAQTISGLDTPNLIIYGGSKKVKAFANKHNLTFINNTTLDLS